jgi:hypothetical protein
MSKNGKQRAKEMREFLDKNGADQTDDRLVFSAVMRELSKRGRGASSWSRMYFFFFFDFDFDFDFDQSLLCLFLVER